MAERPTKTSWLQEVFSPSLYLFAALALASGSAVFLILGPGAAYAAFVADYELARRMLPRIAAAVLIFGFVRVLLPPERISHWIGAGSGVRGLVLATFAGMITPGGPVAMFPMVSALGLAGADRGALVAYSLSWSLLGVQRMMIWEIPLLGADFTLVRFTLAAILPLVAGAVARHLPLDPAVGFKA